MLFSVLDFSHGAQNFSICTFWRHFLHICDFLPTQHTKVLQINFWTDQAIQNYGHRNLNTEKPGRKALLGSYSTKFVKNWAKLTPILKFRTQTFIHKIFSWYHIGSSVPSKTFLIIPLRNYTEFFFKSLLTTTQWPKSYPYPLIIKFSHFHQKAKFLRKIIETTHPITLRSTFMIVSMATTWFLLAKAVFTL